MKSIKDLAQENDILDNHNTNYSSNNRLSAKSVIIWWEKKRIIFTALLIITSVFFIFKYWNHPLHQVLGLRSILYDTLILIILLNLFYTLGWIFEISIAKLFKTKYNASFRWTLFIFGTMISIVVTFFLFLIMFDFLTPD